jgi:hypothetical protein
LPAIHTRAKWHAWKNSSSVAPDGALTEVVTPLGETPTPGWPGAGVGALLPALDDGFADGGGAFSDDEHADSRAIVATAADAIPTAPRNLPTALMCATLFAVMGFIGTRECCQA